jgi:hypothetical protein
VIFFSLTPLLDDAGLPLDIAIVSRASAPSWLFIVFAVVLEDGGETHGGCRNAYSRSQFVAQTRFVPWLFLVIVATSLVIASSLVFALFATIFLVLDPASPSGITAQVRFWRRQVLSILDFAPSPRVTTKVGLSGR